MRQRLAFEPAVPLGYKNEILFRRVVFRIRDDLSSFCKQPLGSLHTFIPMTTKSWWRHVSDITVEL